MSKETEFFDALHGLRSNYPTGVTTWSKCSTDGCDNSARGGGYCAHCWEDKIAKITGDAKLANELHIATATAHRRICRALDIVQEI